MVHWCLNALVILGLCAVQQSGGSEAGAKPYMRCVFFPAASHCTEVQPGQQRDACCTAPKLHAELFCIRARWDQQEECEVTEDCAQRQWARRATA